MLHFVDLVQHMVEVTKCKNIFLPGTVWVAVTVGVSGQSGPALALECGRLRSESSPSSQQEQYQGDCSQSSSSSQEGQYQGDRPHSY